METQYFATRKELTDKLKEAVSMGFKVYRVKEVCNCHPLVKHPEMNLKHSQRNGVLVIDGETVKQVYVRCRICSIKQNQAQNTEQTKH